MNIPNKLYLQITDYGGKPHAVGERTHCEDGPVNEDDVAYIRASRARRLLHAAVYALEHAFRHYLTPSAVAEVWSFVNGEDGMPDIMAELKALEGEY